MNAKKSYILLIIFIAGVAGLYFFNKYRVAPGIALSKLEVADEQGHRVSLADSARGKKVIVSLYASWCGDCLRELKHLAAVKDKELADVTVFAVTDEPVEKLTAFRERTHYPFTFLKLQKTFNEMQVFSIPVVYIFNSKGEPVYEHVGYVDWQDASTLNHLKSLMN